MKNVLMSIFSAEGKISSKRVITIAAFILMSIGFIGNLYWKLTIDKNIYDSMQWIVQIGMGTIVAEKFGKQRETQPVEPPAQP